MPPGSRVLVVDDDSAIRKVVGSGLTDAGYEVTLAANGNEALDALATSPQDAVILDVMMEGLSGLDVLTAMRERPDTDDIPVILLTARAETDDMWEGYKAGADYYMTKPFEMDELLKFLEFVLTKAAG